MPTFIKWPAPVSGVRLEYAPEVLERIRLLAIDGLLALPKVGMAIGGLLIGSVDQGRVRVSDTIEIPCSHAVGPSFVLTSAELARACTMAFGENRRQVVGWYCSRPRGELRLEPQQMALFGQICPEHWQVGLLLQPSTVQPTRALICIRSSDIEYAYGRPMDLVEYVPPVLQTLPEEVVPEVLPPRPPRPVAAAEPVAPVFDQTPPAAATPPATTLRPAPPVHAPPVLNTADTPTDPLVFDEPVEKAVRPRRLYALYALLSVLVIIVLYLFRWDIMDRPQLIVTVAPEGDQVMIRWNVDAIEGIDEGTLSLNDGGQLQSIALSRTMLQSGWLRAPHKSDRVTANLTAGEVSAFGTWSAPMLTVPAPATAPPTSPAR